MMTRRFIPVLAMVTGIAALTPSPAFAPKPVKSFSLPNQSVSETVSTYGVTVNRSVKSGSASVQLSTQDGTAESGSDYTSLSNQTVQFKGGQNSATSTLTLAPDSVAEPNQTVLLNLSAPSAGYTTSNGVLTIINDDVPDAPTNLVAAATSPIEIGLTWDTASDYATGWDIYRGESSGNLSYLDSVATNSFSDDEVLPNSIYYYEVVATNNAGGSPPSNEANATTPGVNIIDNLEAGTAGWAVGGLWHLATSSSCSPSGFHSTTHAFYYGDEGTCTFETSDINGSTANSGVLISPNYTGATSATLFLIRYALVTEDDPNCGSYDVTRVDVSYDGGTNWAPLGGGACLAESSTWRNRSFAIAPTGDTVRFRFTFDTVDEIGNFHLGWFVDDLSLGY